MDSRLGSSMSGPQSSEKRERRGGRRALREHRGAREGLIYAWVPAGIATNVKQLALEQHRPLRALVADALAEYVARVDAAEGTAG